MAQLERPAVEGVILAAGLSTRAGAHKMALPFAGMTVIEKGLEGMYNIVSRAIVVVGYRAERICELLARYPKVQCVLNEEYRSGMVSSVRAGISHVRAPAFFLLPGDHPLVRESVYLQLLATPGEIVIPTCQGRKGHPVLLASGLIPEILSRPAVSSLRDYVQSRGYRTVEVDDRGILFDLDTMADYHQGLAASGAQG